MKPTKRFWEIDFLRGIAVILMIIFNYMFALAFLNIYKIGESWFYWYLFPRIIAGMFILIAGTSMVLGYNKLNKSEEIYSKFFSRGLKIFSLGLGITVVTWIFVPQAYIAFGILHLIGLSTILAIPFLKFRKLNLVLGLLIILSGLYLQNLRFDFFELVWLGFIPKNFYTLDYFPLLPWFGVMLIGLLLGNTFYHKGQRKFKIKNLESASMIKQICFLGRNSLPLYLIHQPVLILFLILLGFRVF